MCWQKLFNNLRFLTQIKKNELQGWFCWFLFLPACISLKQMEIDACKTAYTIWEDIQDAKIFQIGRLFFAWKKQQPFMYILTSQLEQVEKEFIAFYALKWIDKRPPLRQFQIHSYYTSTPKKYVQARFKFNFFCNWSPFLDFRLFFLLPNVLRTWYVSGPEINLFGMHFCSTNTPTCFFFAWAWRHWNQP